MLVTIKLDFPKYGTSREQTIDHIEESLSYIEDALGASTSFISNIEFAEPVKEDDTNEFFASCSCTHEVLRVSYQEHYFDVSIFRWIRNRPLMNKLRMIWKILRTGEPYGDDITIGLYNARKLAQFINDKTTEKKDADDGEGRKDEQGEQGTTT